MSTSFMFDALHTLLLLNLFWLEGKTGRLINVGVRRMLLIKNTKLGLDCSSLRRLANSQLFSCRRWVHPHTSTSTSDEFTSNAHPSINQQNFYQPDTLAEKRLISGALKYSPFDAVKSIATVKLIWVLQEEINHVRRNVEASIMSDYSAAWFKAGSSG